MNWSVRRKKINRKLFTKGGMLPNDFRDTLIGDKINLFSEHGRIDIRLGNGYKTMDFVDWGSNLNLE
jgi:hypothetical protein